MTVVGAFSSLLLAAGTFFCIAGTVALLRFPDVYTRLHAMTKVDNVGLGLIALGLMLQADSFGAAVEIALVWILALGASALAAHLVAASALRQGVAPWQGEKRS